ncbi:MAG: TlpA family protein disulfide reductase [Bacteroides sp.]|nr:TlpA family protein disulfide reductase [Bacteroides sp.]
MRKRDNFSLLKELFIKKNPDKTYAAYLLFNDPYLKDQHFPTYEKTFRTFTPSVKATESGVKIEGELELLRGSGVGATLEEFDLLCLDGNRVKLSDYRGKYVMLDFWASWCGPCRMATPNLMKLYWELEDRDDFEIIGIACKDKEENWRKAVEEDKPAWIQLIDDKGPGAGSLWNKYRIKGIPLALFLDPDGKNSFQRPSQ